MKKINLIFTCLFVITGSAIAQVNLSNGLVGHYQFDGNGNDASGNSNGLTNQGATPTIDRNGNANSAMSFNGSSYMIGNNKSLPTAANSRTISVWVNNATPHSNNNGQHYFTYGPQKLYEGFQLFSRGTHQGPNNIIRVSSIGQDLSHNYTYSQNRWMHIVSTYEDKKVKLWIDGSLVDSSVFKSLWSTTLDSIVIGRSDLRHSFAGFFNGSIDELRIYNRVLSNREIGSLFKGCIDTTVSINDTINNGDSILLAGSYRMVSGNYSDTLQKSSGCDSIISTNLFVKSMNNTAVKGTLDRVSLSIFPNPTSGLITIKGLNAEQQFNLTVVNVLGEMIFEKDFIGENQVDFSQQNSGIYFVVLSDEKNTFSKRIVLEK